MSDPPPSASLSRRTVLVGGALVTVGALAGVGAGLAGHSSDAVAPPNPAVLLAAVHAERLLLSTVDAALRTTAVPAALLGQLRADHAAHLAALTAAVSLATGAATSSSPPVPAVPAAPSRAALYAAETSAASAAAQRALALTGRDAVLLASIAACEASHAELLS